MSLRTKEPLPPKASPIKKMNSNMMMKVFCKNCINYSCFEGTTNHIIKCKAPKNVKDTWYMSKAPNFREPREINKNNNCEWFEEKKSKRKRK